jgi:hypothetical protein
MLIEKDKEKEAKKILNKIRERGEMERWCYKIEWINKRSQYWFRQ